MNRTVIGDPYSSEPALVATPAALTSKLSEMCAKKFALITVLSLLAVASCGTEPAQPIPGAEVMEPDPEPAMVIDPDLPVILAFGDSLTNGHDVDSQLSYPSQLQGKLNALGYTHQVVNFGFDGETTSGGVARLTGALELKPEIVVLEFGGNDGLRGTPIEVAASNLSTMIAAFKEIESTIILAGLTLPRNYGPDYIQAFENMYVDLAEKHEIDLIPFFLEGLVDLDALDSGEATLAESLRYMQSDGTHPTGDGYTIVAETVFSAIESYLSR
jgi:acyl-CoA thioesterase-1